jgi:hypothetical protein
MTTKLGAAILTAARDQGWTLITHEGLGMQLDSPVTGFSFLISSGFLERENEEPLLRMILLDLIVRGGLWWPWPPDHREDIHGETPRHI